MKRKRPSKPPPPPDNVVLFPRKRVSENGERSVWARFRFRNGFGAALAIAAKDVDRVWRLVQDPGGFSTYAVFETLNRHIAVNLHHLSAVQFHGRPGEGLIAEGVPDSKTVDVMFIDAPEWLHIEVEPDELTIADIDDEGVDMEEGEAEAAIQCANLLYYCDSSHEGSDYAQCLQDVRGSETFLRLNDVAIVSIPFDFVRTDSDDG
jgi:hypothetical protein